MHSTGPSWKCVHDTELDQSFSELVGSPPGNENSKSYGQERSKLGQAGRALPASILGLLGVPIGTIDRVFHILPLPGVPLHPVWTGLVRDVPQLMQPNQKVFMQMFFDSLIKLIELYETVEKHFEVQ